MPIKTYEHCRVGGPCHELVCDACGTVARDDNGARLHPADIPGIHTIARQQRWLVTADLTTVVCPKSDTAHQTAYDALLPLAPDTDVTTAQEVQDVIDQVAAAVRARAEIAEEIAALRRELRELRTQLRNRARARDEKNGRSA